MRSKVLVAGVLTFMCAHGLQGAQDIAFTGFLGLMGGGKQQHYKNARWHRRRCATRTASLCTQYDGTARDCFVRRWYAAGCGVGF